MKVSPCLVLAISFGVGLAGCSKRQESAAAKQTNQSASGNPITAPVDYLGAIAKAKKFSERTIDVTSIKQAIQLFYAQEDRFPKDLNELVAKHYIPSVPPGYQYNPQTGELSVSRQQ